MAKKPSTILGRLRGGLLRGRRFDRRGHATRARGYGGFFGGYGGRGGIVNTTTGLGTSLDKGAGSFFLPTRVYWRSPLEVIRVESAAANKAISIPVDDMFLRRPWRQWSDGDQEGAAEKMAMAEERHNVVGALANAMKAGSAYGTGCVVMMSMEAPLTEPLMPERIRPGDLKALHPFDRFDMSVMARDMDPFSPEFQRPMLYRITPRQGGMPFMVHASRVLRFDGITPFSAGGFDSYYDQDWGISELIPILTSLIEDKTLASAITHLSQEASIPILHIDGLREAVAGGNDPDEPGLDEIGQRFNEAKSIWNLAMLDKESEEFERVAVQFNGLALLMDRFAARIAMMCDIPQTRFNGNPPTGMSATGESDMRNYVMMVEAKRVVRLAQPLPRLDAVLARDAGLAEPPEYTWLSLIELSDKEQAEAAKILVQALKEALDARAITEDEFRRQIDGHPVFGALPEMDLETLLDDDDEGDNGGAP